MKILKPLLLPPALIAIGMATGLLCIARKKYRAGKIVLAVTLAAYYLLSLQPIAHLLAKSLEVSVPNLSLAQIQAQAEDREAIVVLAGGADGSDARRPFPELSGASWRRLWHAVELYRALKGRLPILYSGGSGDPFKPFSGEAALAQQYAAALGVPQEKFWIESSSRTTYESSLAVRSALDERFPKAARHKIILVTSVRHIPRARAAFRQAGIDAMDAPADFPSDTPDLNPLSILPSIESFSSSVISVHEWIGRAVYRLFHAVDNA